MFGFIKKMFIALLTSLINVSSHRKSESLSNQKYKIQPTLIYLHLNEYSQELHYYPFAIKLDGYVGSYNTLNDLSSKVCIPNKAEGLNLSVFNKIIGRNEPKTLTMYISCEWKCKFDSRKYNSNQKCNNRKYHVCKNICAKKVIFGILQQAIAKVVNI